MRFFLQNFVMICLNTKKHKSYTSLWHLFHSNSLWGPVNWVSFITRWMSRAANLAMLPFVGPSPMTEGTPLNSSEQRHFLQHTQPGLYSWGKCKAHRVQTRKPDCEWSDLHTANNNPEAKPYCASPWHSTELKDSRMWFENKKLLSSSLAVSHQVRCTLLPCNSSTLHQEQEHCGTTARRWMCHRAHMAPTTSMRLTAV